MNNKRICIMLLFFSLLCGLSYAEDRAAPVAAAQNANMVFDKNTNSFVPKGYLLPEVIRLTVKDARCSMTLFAKRFCQGNAVYLEMCGVSGLLPADVTLNYISYEGTRLPLSKTSFGYRTFFPLAPDIPAGIKTVVCSYTYQKKEYSLIAYINEAPSHFAVYRSSLELGKYADATEHEKPDIAAFINECSVKKQKALTTVSSDMITSGSSHPRDMHYITSPFWSMRIVSRYKTVKGRSVFVGNVERIHKGTDYRGAEGTAAYAVLSGRVVLAEKMYFEGNFIIIDHGNKIFSWYMHMDKLHVHAGDMVKAGDVIGEVGTTGASTGPHLHASLLMQGVFVDSESILPLPIRD